jgi:hypothetical protein
VEAGGDIDAQTRNGDTPLLLSAKNTDEEQNMLCIEVSQTTLEATQGQTFSQSPTDATSER